MSPEDMFRCERLACLLARAICARRQEDQHVVNCLRCPQGAGIRAELGLPSLVQIRQRWVRAFRQYPRKARPAP